jgi:hypothetical protein
MVFTMMRSWARRVSLREAINRVVSNRILVLWIWSMLVATVSGCGSLGAANDLSTRGVPLTYMQNAAGPRPPDMMSSMKRGEEIHNARQAREVRQRAEAMARTIQALHREIKFGQLSQQERVDKSREISQLRVKRRREVELLGAFEERLQRKGYELERLSRLGDPDVERMRRELSEVMDLKGSKRIVETERIQKEFESRIERK